MKCKCGRKATYTVTGRAGRVEAYTCRRCLPDNESVAIYYGIRR
jgi:hypothetical protein